MNGEIAKNEANEIKNSSAESFKSIKPQKGTSIKEANVFWNSEFKQESDAKKSETSAKNYLDDNGKMYREGDQLLPNNTFEMNEYQYKTDALGRQISASGKLRMRDPDYVRNMEKTRGLPNQEYKPSDHEGHLIGHQFGGSDKLENLVPMDGQLNQGDYAKLEGTLADAVRNGADVRLTVEPRYKGDSTRPFEFKVSYSIDGERDVVVFKNGSEEQK